MFFYVRGDVYENSCVNKNYFLFSGLFFVMGFVEINVRRFLELVCEFSFFWFCGGCLRGRRGESGVTGILALFR